MEPVFFPIDGSPDIIEYWLNRLVAAERVNLFGFRRNHPSPGYLPEDPRNDKTAA
jgi:hypothetical protein